MTMTVETFIGILVLSATATSIGIEIVKNLLKEFKINCNSMVLACAVAFIVGAVEVVIYAAQGGMPFNYLTAIYAVCMGIVNVVGTTTGYDTVKAFICALFGKVD